MYDNFCTPVETHARPGVEFFPGTNSHRHGFRPHTELAHAFSRRYVRRSQDLTFRGGRTEYRKFDFIRKNYIRLLTVKPILVFAMFLVFFVFLVFLVFIVSDHHLFNDDCRCCDRKFDNVLFARSDRPVKRAGDRRRAFERRRLRNREPYRTETDDGERRNN